MAADRGPHGHGHSHGHAHAHGEHPHTSPRLRRALLAVMVPVVVLTLAGLVALWPRGAERDVDLGLPTDVYPGTVVEVAPIFCSGGPPGAEQICEGIDVRLEDGPDRGEVVTMEGPSEDGLAPDYRVGDRLLLGYTADVEPPANPYAIVDRERTRPLGLLVIGFALAVIALGRWRGALALVGLGVSLVVLTSFLLPALLEGRSALGVAVVGSAAIMLVGLYLAHGVNARTTVAVLGTLASLALTGFLGQLFIELTQLTGLGSEEATTLRVFASQVDVRGLLLAGIVIGSLGVLDDVTITQVSAVWELHLADPEAPARGLYAAGLRIGRDHIASTVNTLVLAYAGASLPVLLLYSQAGQSITTALSGEVLAVEVVRTLVGSIGLIASVPITTALAALVARGVDPDDATASPEAEAMAELDSSHGDSGA